MEGLKIGLINHVHQNKTPFPIPLSPAENQAAPEQINTLLSKEAIQLCSGDEDDQFISTVFLRPKKDGGFRVILNLKQFNKHVDYKHFGNCTSCFSICYTGMLHDQIRLGRCLFDYSSMDQA